MAWFTKKAPKDDGAGETLPISDNPDSLVVLNQKIARNAVSALGMVIVYAAIVTSYAIYQQENVIVKTFFVNFDPASSQLVRVEQGDLTQSEADRLIRTSLITYVTKRETINPATQDERWAWVQAYTDPDWYKFWMAQVDPKQNDESPITVYRANGMTREVHFRHYVALPNSPDTYEIEYETIDRFGNQEHGLTQEEPARKFWKVTIVARRFDISASPKMADLNPLGLTVFDYVPAALEVSDK